MKRKLCLLMTLCSLLANAKAQNEEKLRFDPEAYTLRTLQMPDGSTLSYKAYEGICYVTRVEDPTYQTLNFYVPADLEADAQVPILLRTYVGGYMAARAQNPSATDATGRALKEGYAVCIPGSRGSTSLVEKNGRKICTGIAPNGLLDLKAAVRYLHFNDDLMPGNADRIFTDGTSAGGAMSALLGITGNSPEYAPYLEKMGAAPGRDDVFAAICYCPITDLNHADCEYEWLYACTNDGVRALNDAQKKISADLAAMCPEYLNSLDLSTPEGEKLTAENYKSYLKRFLIASAHKALQEGAEIPDSIGIIFYREEIPPIAERPRADNAPLDGRKAPSFGPAGLPVLTPKQTDFVADIDLDTYLNYVASVTPLKTPPAFDAWGVLEAPASPENKVFGNELGEPANFTTFSLQQRTHDDSAALDEQIRIRSHLMNPMDFIGDTTSCTPAVHWFIRHGARDRDTSFLVPLNLATKLQNAGADVDFAMPWNRPHAGDYNLDDLFRWIRQVAAD